MRVKKVYMAIRTREQGLFRFYVYHFDRLLEELGGFLPPMFYAYHFEEQEVRNNTRRWEQYRKFPALPHKDGISLGQFPHSFFVNGKEAAEKDGFMGWRFADNDIYPVYDYEIEVTNDPIN